jgi:hypothetical protein
MAASAIGYSRYDSVIVLPVGPEDMFACRFRFSRAGAGPQSVTLTQIKKTCGLPGCLAREDWSGAVSALRKQGHCP